MVGICHAFFIVPASGAAAAADSVGYDIGGGHVDVEIAGGAGAVSHEAILAWTVQSGPRRHRLLWAIPRRAR